MKYWWTLGCFPTGLNAPFRLLEFLATYKQQHVPSEVEEWLDYYIADPAETIEQTIEELLLSLDRIEYPEEAVGYESYEPSIVPVLKPLVKFEETVGVRLDRVSVRATLSTKPLRERLLCEIFDYRDAVREGGSTIHRRMGRLSITEDSEAPQPYLSAGPSSPVPELSEPIKMSCGAALNVPTCTAVDERCLINVISTVAEGACRKRRYDAAAEMLAEALMFAYDDDTAGNVHCMLSSARNLGGRYHDAALHGREAALLTKSPRGFANWAVATAYMDNFEQAISIVDQGLLVHKNDELLLWTRNSIENERAKLPLGSVPMDLRKSRVHSPARYARGVEEASGRGHMNEFDTVVFKNKIYARKLDPTTMEMGSVFRRVGDVAGFISSTKSMERL
jgi:hypothetical protein